MKLSNEQTILVRLRDEQVAPLVVATHLVVGQFWLEFYLGQDKIPHTVFNRDAVKFFKVIPPDEADNP